MKGAEAIILTVGDYSLYLDARLGGFHWSRIVSLALFDNQNKGGSVFVYHYDTVKPDNNKFFQN